MQFGDSEPEDAWDPDDPVLELVLNLARRLAPIRDELAPALELEARRPLDRLVWLERDLVHVAGRLADELEGPD